ncbi:unnamed protein product [Caenorhabditis brenneri]
MLRNWFFVLFPFILVIASGQSCSSTTCPTGGIWGQWTTTGSCATTCGACSYLTYTRTCVSTGLAGGCPCTGDSSINMTCGTQACNYPRTNASGQTCCTGTPMVINNWYHCGPLSSNNTLACCPTGGYWSVWGAWVKQANMIQWTRTRTCLSGDLNCPCSGDTIDSTYTCPCIRVTVINSTTTCSSATAKQPFFVRTPYYNPSKCVAAFVAEASNYRHTFYTASGTNFLTTIGWVDSTGACQAADVKGLGGLGTAGTFFKLEFPCNLTTGRFGGVVDGNSMTDLAAIAQFY